MVRTRPRGYPEARTSLSFFRQRRCLLKLAGKDALDFLHRLSTNDLRGLPDGGHRRTILVNEKGRIIDVVTVARSGETLTLIGSGGNGPGLAGWLERFIIMEDVRIAEQAHDPGTIRLVGPGSPRLVAEGKSIPSSTIVIREDVGTLPAYLVVGDADISGLPEMDERAFEAIRIEEGVPAFGRELTDDFNPLEAGLIGEVSFSKGCYIGQEVIARLDTYKKLQKIISSFEFPGYDGTELPPGKVFHREVEAGIVTSTAYSPAQEGWIGLGYLRLKSAAADLVLKQADGGEGVPARTASGLPEQYEAYEIAPE